MRVEGERGGEGEAWINNQEVKRKITGGLESIVTAVHEIRELCLLRALCSLCKNITSREEWHGGREELYIRRYKSYTINDKYSSKRENVRRGGGGREKLGEAKERVRGKRGCKEDLWGRRLQCCGFFAKQIRLTRFPSVSCFSKTKVKK